MSSDNGMYNQDEEWVPGRVVAETKHLPVLVHSRPCKGASAFPDNFKLRYTANRVPSPRCLATTWMQRTHPMCYNVRSIGVTIE